MVANEQVPVHIPWSCSANGETFLKSKEPLSDAEGHLLGKRKPHSYQKRLGDSAHAYNCSKFVFGEKVCIPPEAEMQEGWPRQYSG